jgi:hypothetical protein
VEVKVDVPLAAVDTDVAVSGAPEVAVVQEVVTTATAPTNVPRMSQRRATLVDNRTILRNCTTFQTLQCRGWLRSRNVSASRDRAGVSGLMALARTE